MKKRDIYSLIFNSELLSKLRQMGMAGLLILGLICGGISGCGTEDSDKPTSPVDEPVVVQTEPDEVHITDLYVGDSIIFEEGGTVYEGLVIDGVSNDEILVRLTDGSEEVINHKRIDGTLIANHPDLETGVVMLSEREGERILAGKIVGTYDDGTRKIEILEVKLLDGRREILDVPRIRFVHEDTKYRDGGYLTLDEFARVIAGQFVEKF